MDQSQSPLKRVTSGRLLWQIFASKRKWEAKTPNCLSHPLPNLTGHLMHGPATKMLSKPSSSGEFRLSWEALSPCTPSPEYGEPRRISTCC